MFCVRLPKKGWLPTGFFRFLSFKK
jgi:hypothetical protein